MIRYPQPLHHTATRLAVILLAAASVLAACSPFGRDGDPTVANFDSTPATGAASELGGEESGGSTLGDLPINAYSSSSTRAVVTAEDLRIRTAPDGPVIETMAAVTEYGTTRVLLVDETRDGWVRVRLPMRPNHRSGWVPADDVVLDDVQHAIRVDLEQRRLTVTADDDVILHATVAVGSAEHPTPAGTFYITDKLETSEPAGTYGPYALGLSGYSETLTEFAGGDGQIGIHGTDDPNSLGQAVSHGCVRLPNDLVAMMADLVPLGTPVHIV